MKARCSRLPAARPRGAHTLTARCPAARPSPLCAVATSQSQYLLSHAERYLLRLDTIFAVCHGEQRGVIPRRQFACPLHVHGIFLSGKEALLRAFSLGHKLAVGI